MYFLFENYFKQIVLQDIISPQAVILIMHINKLEDVIGCIVAPQRCPHPTSQYLWMLPSYIVKKTLKMWSRYGSWAGEIMKLFRWAEYHSMGPHKRKAGRSRLEEGTGTIEAKIGVM